MRNGKRGPGTLVVTVCISDWGYRNVSRVPNARRVGAANPANRVRACAPTAWRCCLRWSICSRSAASRATGSGSPTGRFTSTAEIRLFSTPRSCLARTETGTRERTTAPPVSSPRAASRSRKPRVTAASTTSLTVPPNALRTSLTSSRFACAHSQRRWGPTGPLSVRAEAPTSRRAVPTSPRPKLSTLSREGGLRTSEGMRASWWIGSSTASRSPPTTAPSGDGPGRGVHSVGRVGAASGASEAQLLVTARRRYGGVPDVVEDLEVFVVCPHRAAEMQWDGAHALPVPGHERQLAHQQPDQVAIGRSGPLEHGHRTDVHRDLLVLEVVEPGVDHVHPVHRAPARDRRPRRAAAASVHRTGQGPPPGTPASSPQAGGGLRGDIPGRGLADARVEPDRGDEVAHPDRDDEVRPDRFTFGEQLVLGEHRVVTREAVSDQGPPQWQVADDRVGALQAGAVAQAGAYVVEVARPDARLVPLDELEPDRPGTVGPADVPPVLLCPPGKRRVVGTAVRLADVLPWPRVGALVAALVDHPAARPEVGGGQEHRRGDRHRPRGRGAARRARAGRFGRAR